MKKYQWNNVKLQKKSQVYDIAMYCFAIIALVAYFIQTSVLWLFLCLIGAVVCFVLAWQIKKQDIRLKAGKKHN